MMTTKKSSSKPKSTKENQKLLKELKQLCKSPLVHLIAVLVIFAGLGAGIMVTSRANNIPSPIGVAGNWQYTWGDEFDGTALDSSKWRIGEHYQNAPGFSMGGDSEAYCPVPAPADVVAVNNGSLKMSAVKRPTGGKEWQSCVVTTWDRYMSFGHGYIEGRFKLPGGARNWPAFWMMGQGQWPANGEIDIFEFVNNGGDNGRAFVTLHWDAYCNPEWKHCQTEQKPYPPVLPNWLTQWHTFGMKRTATSIEIYINGQFYHSYSSDYRTSNGLLIGQQLFSASNPMFVLLSMGQGGAWAYDPNRAAQAGTMEVDYIRAWVPSSSSSDTTAPTISITAPTSGSNTAVGSTVTINANASDNIGVARVEFYSGTTLLNTDTTAPYSFAWNTTGQTAGTKTLTAKAYDAVGNVAESSSVSISLTTSTQPVTPVAIPFRMNTGGPAITDDKNTSWSADQYSTGGSAVDRGTGVAIVGTTNDRLYQMERWGMTSYNIPIANGTYTYRLHFAETSPSCSTVGCRVQSVTVEGSPFLTNFDIIKEAGHFTAIVKEGKATVTDGRLDFGFTQGANASMLNGIEILAANTTTGNGDANGDGRVNAIDLSIIISKDGQNYPAADFNNDGTVGAADMAVLLSKWTW